MHVEMRGFRTVPIIEFRERFFTAKLFCGMLFRTVIQPLFCKIFNLFSKKYYFQIIENVH